MDSSSLTLRDVSPADRQAITNLIHFEMYVHRHLDWRSPIDWIGHRPYLVALQENRVTAILACPADPPEIAWIRVFATASGTHPGLLWQTLWEAARKQLIEQKNLRVAAIALQPWFSELLESSGFIHTDNIVVLVWETGTPLPPPKPLQVKIRQMQATDIEAVFAIDSTVFEVEWRNSRSALEIAFQQASLATVIEDDHGILGYQISTAGPIGGHLARLAVRRDSQLRGIGYCLVYHLLTEFSKLGLTHITVNTQQDNLPSLSVYSRAGFKITDEQYQVYQYWL
jgi:ribosomal protein S18 acetylase RimI-like enzyme